MSSGPGGPGGPGGGAGGPGGFAGGPGGFAGGPGGSPSEEELRAAYEAELKRLRVEQLLIEHVVGMINLGMRRTGLAPGTEDERDPGQVRLAIEAIRALMPLLEEIAPEQAAQVRAALSQLQLAFVRIGGQPGARAGEPDAPGGPEHGEPQAPPGAPSGRQEPGTQPSGPSEGGGPAQRSGRLWVPGQ